MMDWLTHITGEKTEGLLNQEERRWVIFIETSRRILIPIFSNGLTLPRRRGEKSGFPGRELNRRREDESGEDVVFDKKHRLITGININARKDVLLLLKVT